MRLTIEPEPKDARLWLAHALRRESRVQRSNQKIISPRPIPIWQFLPDLSLAEIGLRFFAKQTDFMICDLDVESARLRSPVLFDQEFIIKEIDHLRRVGALVEKFTGDGHAELRLLFQPVQANSSYWLFFHNRQGDDLIILGRNQTLSLIPFDEHLERTRLAFENVREIVAKGLDQ